MQKQVLSPELTMNAKIITHICRFAVLQKRRDLSQASRKEQMVIYQFLSCIQICLLLTKKEKGLMTEQIEEEKRNERRESLRVLEW